LSVQQQSIGFNGTVMISWKDSVVYRPSVGKASLELDVQLSSDPVFRIASITKQFTAMLVVLAAEEHKLALDDQFSKYYPQLGQSDWSNITIRQLLTHTSGLPHNEGIADYWEKISFFLKGAQLFAKMGQNPFFELYPSDSSVFFGKKVPVLIEFEKDSDDTIKGLNANLKGQSIHFVKNK